MAPFRTDLVAPASSSVADGGPVHVLSARGGRNGRRGRREGRRLTGLIAGANPRMGRLRGRRSLCRAQLEEEPTQPDGGGPE
eukprot:53900-Alexandrium_andersonii.AAC.1